MPAYLVVEVTSIGNFTKADLLAGKEIPLVSCERYVATDEQAAMTLAATARGRGGRFIATSMAALVVGRVPEQRTLDAPVIE